MTRAHQPIPLHPMATATAEDTDEARAELEATARITAMDADGIDAIPGGAFKGPRPLEKWKA